jgi:hypothetical protein
MQGLQEVHSSPLFLTALCAVFRFERWAGIARKDFTTGADRFNIEPAFPGH